MTFQQAQPASREAVNSKTNQNVVVVVPKRRADRVLTSDSIEHIPAQKAHELASITQSACEIVYPLQILTKKSCHYDILPNTLGKSGFSKTDF